jgi:muconolactone delta-isomerase
MEFLVEFDPEVPQGAAKSEVARLNDAEATAAARLAKQGHLARLWREPTAPGGDRALGLYLSKTQQELESLLRALPLYNWMHVTVTPLEPHPNDPDHGRPTYFELPTPRLTPLYRLEATLGNPLELGKTADDSRNRIVPITGGTFRGMQMSGSLVSGASADWQRISPDGTVFGDIRYTLQTDSGALLYVESQSVRHGTQEVLGRLDRGEDVDPSEYTFRTSTRIRTGAADLEWLNKGVFVGVAGRGRGSVIYETYLVH